MKKLLPCLRFGRERDTGDVKMVGQLGIWILDFVYPFWMKLWLHFIQNKITKIKKTLE